MAIDPQTIQLSENQRRQLARLADQYNQPWDDVLSEALSGYRAKKSVEEVNHVPHESLYDALLRDGLIGAVKDAPPDMSTNPR